MHHGVTKRNEVMFPQYTEKGNIQGDFLAEINTKGFIERIEVVGRDITVCILQKGQCL